MEKMAYIPANTAARIGETSASTAVLPFSSLTSRFYVRSYPDAPELPGQEKLGMTSRANFLTGAGS